VTLPAVEIDYPHLAEEGEFGGDRLRFEVSLFPPVGEDIADVHVVPFVGDACLIVRENGDWSLPGDEREPGETWPSTARRGLRRTAGSDLLSFTPFGLLRGGTSVVLVGCGRARLGGRPRKPAVEVAVVPVDEAVRRFTDAGRPWMADVYRLADSIHTNGC
jgi:hypothetical protein